MLYTVYTNYKLRVADTAVCVPFLYAVSSAVPICGLAEARGSWTRDVTFTARLGLIGVPLSSRSVYHWIQPFTQLAPSSRSVHPRPAAESKPSTVQSDDVVQDKNRTPRRPVPSATRAQPPVGRKRRHGRPLVSPRVSVRLCRAYLARPRKRTTNRRACPGVVKRIRNVKTYEHVPRPILYGPWAGNTRHGIHRFSDETNSPVRSDTRPWEKLFGR